MRNQKSKKEIWQCSQNLDLNQICGVAQGCARFAAIQLVRTHCQFFHKRCSFISHRPSIVEPCNSCRVDNKFVGAPLENVNISAERAYPLLPYALRCYSKLRTKDCITRRQVVLTNHEARYIKNMLQIYIKSSFFAGSQIFDFSFLLHFEHIEFFQNPCLRNKPLLKVGLIKFVRKFVQKHTNTQKK